VLEDKVVEHHLSLLAVSMTGGSGGPSFCDGAAAGAWCFFCSRTVSSMTFLWTEAAQAFPNSSIFL